MRILITGGFGLVGGRLGQHLHRSGHQVILGSRSARGSPSWLPQAEMVQTDWNDGRVLEKICCGVDAVIQAAGMNAQECAADPLAALEFNGVATARLFGAASRAGVKRFVCLSTAHVYAGPLVGTITEGTCPRNLHPYAASHLAGENAVLGTSRRGQTEGIVLRLSNAFGAPVHKDVNCWMLLVNDLCRQAAQSGRMVLHSSGLQQRDFIAMTEVCRVVEHMAIREFDALPHNIFNVGSGVSRSVLELAQLIQQRCKLVLDFEPELQRPEADADEKHEKLEFRQDRLAKMNLNLSSDCSMEIDGLLAFCRASFSENGRGDGA